MLIRTLAATGCLAVAACTGPGAPSASADKPATAAPVTAAPVAPAPNAAPAANPYGGGPVQPISPPRMTGSPPAPPIQNSLADATLRSDVLRTVLSASAQIVPGCDSAQAAQSISVGVATVSERPGAGGVWQEVWPVSLCGQTRQVQLDFVPTPQQGGTDFHITLRNSTLDAADK